MKIGNIYNLDSFKQFLDSHKRSGFTDSYAGIVLARNLTAVDPRLFEKKYPDLNFVNSGIEANNTGGYARRIQSLRLVEQGKFKTAGDQSDTKGKISLTAEDSFLKVIEREGQSKWTESEIKEADLQGINLVTRYVEAHNKIYMREIDQVGYIGLDGQKGLLNHADIVSSAAGGTIETRNAQQMYDEIAGLITDQWNGVNNTPEYMANRVDMPVRVFNKLAETILNTAAGSSTVLKALKDNFPGVSFQGTFRADNSTDLGLGASSTTAYNNNSEAMVMRIPVPLTVGEIIKIGSFDFQVDSKYRVAGFDLLETTAARRLTGL